MKITVQDPIPFLPVYQMKGSKWWCLMDDYEITIFIDGKPYIFFAPAAYRYDRSTMKWEGLISKDSLGCKGALVHDLLCALKGVLYQYPGVDEPSVTPYRTFTRPEADKIFYAVMLADGVKPWRAWVAWKYVSLGKNW